MKIERASLPLTPALTLGNSTQGAFATPIPQVIEPTLELGFDGFWPQHGEPLGSTAQNYVFVMPYAQIGAGSNFSVRVYGWRRTAGQLNSQNATQVWVPYLLTELFCTTSNVNGPITVGPGTPLGQPAVLDGTTFLCDTIVQTQGDPLTKIVSTGPSTDLPAFAVVDIQGSMKISFDFRWEDAIQDAGMNALWSLI